jgi:multiple sugar transport system substrate-binding protein
MSTGGLNQGLSRRGLLRSGAATAAIGSGVLAAACGAAGGTESGTGSTAAQSAGPVTIFWSAWGAGERVDQYKSQAERFTKANPNIKVEFIAQSGTDYNAQITSLLTSNTQLDVSRLDGYFISSYVANKSILQLDPLMSADKSFKKQDYLDGVFLDHHQVFDGKTYAMPNGDSPRVLFYNTALWQSAGAQDPNELESKGQWTWDTFLTALRQISRGAGTDKVWGTRAYLTGPEMWPWVRMNGGRVLSQDLKTVQVDQAPALEALQWQLDLITKHQVAPAAGQEPANAFTSGKLASFVSGNWEAQSWKLAGFKDFSVAPLPKGPRGRFTVFKPNGLAMPNTVKHKDQAWKLMRYLVDDLEKEYIDSGTFMNFRKENSEYFTKNYPGPNAKWFVEPFSKKEVIPVDITKHWGDMNKILNEEMNAARDGKKSLRDATGEVKRQVDLLLKQA